LVDAQIYVEDLPHAGVEAELAVRDEFFAVA